MDEKEQRLRMRVLAGARKRWNDTEMDLFAAQRLEFELSLINKGGWADYFLMVADMVEAARGAGGIVGPGRGRAVASVVLYALGVTGVNPFKHENILFERFLPPEIGKDASLICVDFDGIGYAAALAYLTSNYGDIKAEERKGHAAPECWHVCERCIGVTHLEALDRIAFTTKLIAETGGTVPDLEHLKRMRHRRCKYFAEVIRLTFLDSIRRRPEGGFADCTRTMCASWRLYMPCIIHTWRTK